MSVWSCIRIVVVSPANNVRQNRVVNKNSNVLFII
jgi:hypothetical protein